MLKHDHEHYAKHAKIITDEKNREAFWYLVAFAAALKDFECEIRFSGSGKRSFRFFWPGGGLTMGGTSQSILWSPDKRTTGQVTK